VSYVMVCAGLAGRSRTGRPAPVGQYLKSYDPEAHDGQGAVVWTRDVTEARVFLTHREALLCWQWIPRNRPRRPDGQPNRPLTAFTIEISPVAAEIGQLN